MAILYVGGDMGEADVVATLTELRPYLRVLVALATSNARNSTSMLGEPHPHLLIGPSPLEGVGIQPVVLRPTGQHIIDELFPTTPRTSLQVVVAERPHQQLRLVQPRRMGRCEA